LTIEATFWYDAAMRKNIILYLNGKREEISSEHSFMTTAEFLRYKKNLTGTKVVCSEGDCGACTILVSRLEDGKMGPYKSLNSCIKFLYLLDRCHLITVEGVGQISHMHPVQESMVKCHGAQCGYCTPGIVCSLAQMTNDLKELNKSPTEQKVKNYLSGNLCRCTGYEPIIKAGMDIDMSKVETFESVYDDKTIQEDLKKLNQEVLVSYGDKSIYLPSTREKAIEYKNENEDLVITSGATDLGVVHNKGKININKTLSLNNVDSMYSVKVNENDIEFGAKVSLNTVGDTCEKYFPEFSRMLHIFASPQIKNAGTLVGNIVNASPISDTVPFLRVANAKLKISSSKKTRIIDINDFIKDGYKNLDLNKDELVESVIIPKTQDEFKLYKVSVRKDLDISTVTFACRYKLNGEKIQDIAISFGGVAAFVIRAHDLEKKAIGQPFNQQTFKDLSSQVRTIISPLSDHRGSDEYRNQLCENLLLKFCDEVIQENNFSFAGASI
jgi:xanthine dehydrogenase small subunit